MILRELKYSIFQDETFQVVVSLIDLDPQNEYDIDIDFIDPGTEKSVYKIEGHLKVDPQKPKNMKNGFIVMEPVSDLPDSTTDRFVVQVHVVDLSGERSEGSTDLLAIKEKYPYE
ncbi:hypothetical protein LbDm2_2268 [Levilactobacillus brevis]|nr:hypothetical protein LbDm2_2268 [Levilactobacillus brevis]